MIFQEPMMSLNPLHTVNKQIQESILKFIDILIIEINFAEKNVRVLRTSQVEYVLYIVIFVYDILKHVYKCLHAFYVYILFNMCYTCLNMFIHV